LERHGNHPTIPHGGQQITESSEPVVHIEVEQTEAHCLSQINDPGPPDERGPSQYPKDAEREEISELLDEPQSKLEQLSTTTPMTSAPPGDTKSDNPYVGVTEERSPSLEIHQDKGKQCVGYVTLQEGSSSARESVQSQPSWPAYNRDELAAVKTDLHTWAKIANNNLKSMNALGDQFAMCHNIAVSTDQELWNLERRMGILSPPAKSEECYHAQEPLTPIIKVEDLEPIEMPQSPREMHSDRERQQINKIQEWYTAAVKAQRGLGTRRYWGMEVE
jgi:hypothetical protein